MGILTQRLSVAPVSKLSSRHAIKFGSYSFNLQETTHREVIGLASELCNNSHGAIRFVLDNCTASVRASVREVLRRHTEINGEGFVYQPAILWLSLVDWDGKMTRLLQKMSKLRPQDEVYQIAALCLTRGAEDLVDAGGIDVRG
jgi:hypothetical protein